MPRRTAIAAALTCAFACSGSDEQRSALTTDPKGPLDFGAVAVGETVVLRVLLRNAGDAPVPVDHFSMTGELPGVLEIDAPAGVQVAEGGSLEVRLVYTASRPGRGEAIVEVYDTPAAESPIATVDVAAGEASDRDGGVVAARDGGVVAARDGGEAPRDGGVLPRDGGPCFSGEWTSEGVFPAISSPNAFDDEDPTIAWGKDRFIAMWRSDDTLNERIGGDYDILLSESFDGLVWSMPRAVHSDMATDSRSERSPVIVSDGQGSWAAAWLHGISSGSAIRLFAAFSEDDGQTWDVQQVFESTEPNDDADPDLATDGAGTWVLAWHGHDDSRGQLFVSVRAPTSQSFSAPEYVDPRDWDWAGEPSVAAGEPGQFVVLFTSTSSLGDTIGDDPDTLIVRSTDGGESWTDAAPLFASASSDGVEDHAVEVVGTPSRMVAVVRENVGPDWLLVTTSDDNGETWTSPDMITEDTPSDVDPALATDGRGNWALLTHSHSVGGGDGDIISQWSSDDGRTWTTPVLIDPPLTDGVDDQVPAVASDGFGNWVALWKADGDGAPDTIGWAHSTCLP